MNILIEDSKGVWWKFYDVSDRCFDVVLPGERFQTGYDCWDLAGKVPLIVGQSGHQYPGHACDPETCGYLSTR